MNPYQNLDILLLYLSIFDQLQFQWCKKGLVRTKFLEHVPTIISKIKKSDANKLSLYVYYLGVSDIKHFSIFPELLDKIDSLMPYFQAKDISNIIHG